MTARPTAVVYVVWSGSTLLRVFRTRAAAERFADDARGDGFAAVRVGSYALED